MLKLQFTHEDQFDQVDLKVLRQAFGALGAELQDATGTISAGFVDDARMRTLNKQYSGQDEPTDVLSFNYKEDGAVIDSEELGDVVINIDAATRQAKDYDLDISHEAALLLVHGVLHLLDYDHQNEDEQHQLDKIQSRIMAAVGMPYRDFWTQ